jgi:hypothetical protein
MLARELLKKESTAGSTGKPGLFHTRSFKASVHQERGGGRGFADPAKPNVFSPENLHLVREPWKQHSRDRSLEGGVSGSGRPNPIRYYFSNSYHVLDGARRANHPKRRTD